MQKILALPKIARSAIPTPAVDEGYYLFADSDNSDMPTTVKNVDGASVFNALQNAGISGQLTQIAGAAPSTAQTKNTILVAGAVPALSLARTSAGVYTITSDIACFTANKTLLSISGVAGFATIEWTSTTVITIKTYDETLAAADDILSGTKYSIEVTL